MSACCQEHRDEIERIERHRDILAEALAEIKATVDGASEQPVKDIVYGCIKEVTALPKI